MFALVLLCRLVLSVLSVLTVVWLSRLAEGLFAMRGRER